MKDQTKYKLSVACFSALLSVSSWYSLNKLAEQHVQVRIQEQQVSKLQKEEQKRLQEHLAKQRQEIQCVRQALFFEARGESLQGIKAVASVIVNRKNSGAYPDSYCKVIHQDKQFSYVQEQMALRGSTSLPKTLNTQDMAKVQHINKIASEVVLEAFKPTLPASVMWYARKDIKNYWTKVKIKVVTIGQHSFYKKKVKKQGEK
jgi:spore germination cell wall hydrolase CwlJ-like protein